MTVKEMIEELKDYEDDLIVVRYPCEGEGSAAQPISCVELCEGETELDGEDRKVMKAVWVN